jgi:hypothetical protein
MIWARNRLGVGTRHHSVGDGFVPCEFGVPARALMIGAYAVRPTVTASPCTLTGKRGVSAHGVGREERGVSVPILLPAKPGTFLICWQTGTYRGGWESRRPIHGYAVSARAGTTEFARHEAVPDRVMASANAQAILRPNHGPKSGGPNLAKQSSTGPAKSAITAYPWVVRRDTRLPGPSPFARKRGVSPFIGGRRCRSRGGRGALVRRGRSR